MTDKHTRKEDGIHQTTSLGQTIVELPRSAKRAIMLISDAIAVPLALWAALVLKFDRFDPPLENHAAYFLVALSAVLAVFSILGLYRAVIRFMGPKAMVMVIAGVTLAVLILAGYDRLDSSAQLPA